ncbi:MAG TPA: hypothetical protein VGU63_16970 [Candidatus Acidoferrales bacterium]|nr:hypothetical protein [Candidatus Acidoferrales bacterium]
MTREKRPIENTVRILLIENDAGVSPLIAEGLKQKFGCGAYLQCTSKLSSVWQSLADDEFAAILVDLSIANGFGNVLIPTIRSLAPETPLFALLDQGGESQGQEALRRGVDGCFFKHELHSRAWLAIVCRSARRHRTLPRFARM